MIEMEEQVSIYMENNNLIFYIPNDESKESSLRNSYSAFGNEYTVIIKDKGVGKEKEQFDYFYIMFERLHRQSDCTCRGFRLVILKG